MSDKINPFGFQPPFDSEYKGKNRRWTLRAFFKVPGVYIIKRAGVIVYVGMSQSNAAKACYNHFCQWPPDRRTPHRRVTYLENDYSDFEIMIIQTTPEEAPKVERALVISLEPRDNWDRFEDYLEQFKIDITKKDNPEPATKQPEAEADDHHFKKRFKKITKIICVIKIIPIFTSSNKIKLKPKTMKNITFDAEMNSANQRDIISFTQSIFKGHFLENKKVDRIYVGNWTETPDEEVDTMTTVQIYFQIWEKGESGKGTHFIYKIYRAKNFSCSQSSFIAKKWDAITTPELSAKKSIYGPKIVKYYMKGQPRQIQKCDSLAEAQEFMRKLAINRNCEAYGIARNV